MKFTAAVFAYSGKPTVPTQFSIQLECLQNAQCSEYALMSDNHNYIVTHTINNFTILDVNFKGQKIDTAYVNLSLTLTSV